MFLQTIQEQFFSDVAGFTSISEALGLAEGKPPEPLAKAVTGLAKRLETLEGKAGARASPDGTEFKVDGVSVGNETLPAYYPYPDAVHALYTGPLPNGNHTLSVVAYDKAGNTATASVVVNVQNNALPAAGGAWICISGLVGLALVLVEISVKRRVRHA